MEGAVLLGASCRRDVYGCRDRASCRQPGREGYARYTAELKDIRYKDGTEKPLKGFAYVYETNPKEIYGPGVKLSVKGEMTPIRIYDNPGKSI